MSLRRIVFDICLLGSTNPAFAQAPAPPVVQRMIAPAQLETGRAIAAKLLPDGTYQTMMRGSLSQIMGNMSDQMANLPLAPFLKASGLSPADVARLGSVTMKEVLEIVDPAYDQRMKAMMPVMMREIGDLMTGFEPEMREGLAEAYAAHFTPEQLGDIAAFLNTPSGSAFAAKNLTMSTDPAVMARLQALMPKVMQGMPAIMQKAAAATADLPQPKTPQTLTAADRVRLARLLGVDPAKMN